MKFKFTQNISCKDSADCSDNLFAKLKDLIEISDQNQFHISICHKPNNHVIWVFLYSNKGEHEAETHDKDIKTKAAHIKKFTGKIPTLDKLKQVLL